MVFKGSCFFFSKDSFIIRPLAYVQRLNVIELIISSLEIGHIIEEKAAKMTALLTFSLPYRQ